ncbi:MAG TPA: universal stress protein [Hanamia sp.]|nr:universal stress protein [Hanamia sp.]
MKQILVPTDFSECADNATNFSVQSAKILPAKVTLLHSYEINSSLYTDYMGVNKEYNQTVLNDAKKSLAALKKGIKETGGPAIDSVISTGSLQDAIKKSVEEKKIDLIVMGTLGASGIKEKLFGSRTAATIGKSTVPVMAVPNDYVWEKPKKILLATNRFEKDPAILDYIFELAGLYMANIQVAVFTDEDDDKAGTFLDHKRQISEYELFLKEHYKEDTLTSAHLYGEKFEETLQNFIEENNIDILVMVTYPHKFWNRIFNPSKTKRMSYQTKVPLLAIPVTNSERKKINILNKKEHETNISTS